MTDIILKRASYGVEIGQRISVSPERADELVAANIADLAPAEQPGKPATIEAILADVGEDKAKAQAALEEETGRGGDARATLVSKLQAIVAS